MKSERGLSVIHTKVRKENYFMNKKLCTLIMAFLIFMMSIACHVAFASEVLDVSAIFSVESDELVISGKGSGMLIVTVMEEGMKFEDMSDDNLPAVFRQVEANGTYKTELQMPDGASAGKYYAVVSSDSGEKSASFIYYTKAMADNAASLLSSAQSRDEFETVLTANMESLGIDKDDERLKANFDEIIDMLYSSDFDDGISFGKLYNTAYAYSSLNGADADEVEYIISKFGDYLGIDFNKYFYEDKNIDDKTGAELLSMIANENFADKFGMKAEEYFPQKLNELKVLSVVKNAPSWAVVKNALTEDYAELFEDVFSSSYYKAINNQTAVFEKMMTKSYADFEDIISFAEAAIEEVYDDENSRHNQSSGGGRGSGGGGGGFGGGPSITTPVVTPDDKKEEPETADSYADVTKTHWSYNAVESLSESGIMNGYGNGKFEPDKNITRAEFTKIAYSIFAGASDMTAGDIRFADVSESDWFFDVVSDAALAGIINGDGNSFRPYDAITREDAALIVYRTLALSGKKVEGDKNFADKSDISDYARDAVNALYASGYVSGGGNDMFFPKNHITRAEAAQLIYNVLQKG